VSRRASSDAAILGQLIGLHFYHEPITLDATWGRGVIWRGCPYQPTTRFDQRQMDGVDAVGAWSDLPRLFEPGSFQLVVWDPPHQTDGGERAFSKGEWSNAYGTSLIRGFDNISHLYPGFLESARQILVDNGMLLAKVADMVHGNEQQLQAVDLVVAARAAGWTVCEMVPKMRQPTPNDPRWRRQLHIRKAWSYWICAHPGPQCTAVGVALVRRCEGCGRDFRARRTDAKVCGNRCWMRVSRRKSVGLRNATEQVLSPTKRGP
jgi:hypothetical protein